jgi:hypothetical protein
MGKVVKLTERDLYNIVRRVIKEQSDTGLVSKLREKGFEDAKNTSGKTVLVKRIPGAGDFFFEIKDGEATINVLNPSNATIAKFNIKLMGKNKIGQWYTKGTHPEVEAERLSDFIIKSFGTSEPSKTPTTDSPTPMEEDRFDFGKMSDDELHDLHPHIKKHPKHFKDFSPTSEFLGWKGEVDKRNIYKRHGKFHNAFDKEK